MRVLLLLLLISTPLSAEDGVYKFAARLSRGQWGYGSAVCILRTRTMSVLATAKHNLEGSATYFVHDGNEWHKAVVEARHRIADIALVEIGTSLEMAPVAVGVPSGVPVVFTGFTSATDYERRETTTTKPGYAAGTIMTEVGQSGGAVFAETSYGPAVVGIGSAKFPKMGVSEYTPSEVLVALVRAEYGKRIPTQFGRAYTLPQCQNGMCPVPFNGGWRTCPPSICPPPVYRPAPVYRPPGGPDNTIPPPPVITKPVKPIIVAPEPPPFQPYKLTEREKVELAKEVAAIVLAQMQDKIPTTEQIARELPPVILQPMYRTKDGLKAADWNYRGRLGEAIPLDPIDVDVMSYTGRKSKTTFPIGGNGTLLMGDKVFNSKEDNGKGR